MKNLFYTLCLLLSGILPAKGTDIHLKFLNPASRNILFGYYQGDISSKTVLDTIMLRDGEGVLSFPLDLPFGVYFLQDKDSSFPVIMGDDQSFTVTVDEGIIPHKVSFTGSNQNSAFMDYLNFPEDSLGLNLSLLRDKLSSDFKGQYLAKLMLSLSDPEIPSPPDSLTDVSEQMMFRIDWYITHYFDNFDYTDTDLLRSPFYNDRILSFYQDILPAFPDSIDANIDRMLSRALPNRGIFNHLAGLLLNFYQNSDMVTSENLWVGIADRWILPNQDIWEDSYIYDFLKTEVPYRKPNLIGETAPALDLDIASFEDIQKAASSETLPSMRAVPMDSILTSKLNLIVFWEPGCAHCLEQLPLIRGELSGYSHEEVSVTALMMVELPEALKLWVKLVDYLHLDNFRHARSPRNESYKWDYNILSTPAIYILDSEGKILLKNFDIEQMPEIIDYMLSL